MALTPVTRKQSRSSPLSFVGASRRLSSWTRGRRSTVGKVASWAALVVVLPMVWLFLVVWYVVAFGVFGIVTVPLRLLRRHQRKALAVQEEQRDLLRQLAERQG